MDTPLGPAITTFHERDMSVLVCGPGYIYSSRPSAPYKPHDVIRHAKAMGMGFEESWMLLFRMRGSDPGTGRKEALALHASEPPVLWKGGKRLEGVPIRTHRLRCQAAPGEPVVDHGEVPPFFLHGTKFFRPGCSRPERAAGRVLLEPITRHKA